LGTKIPESLSAPTHADGNKNKEDNQHLVDHKSIIEITKGKCCNELKPADENDVSAEPTQDTPLILNHRIRRCLLGPMSVANCWVLGSLPMWRKDPKFEKPMSHLT